MADTSQEMVWLRSFLKDLGISSPSPMPNDKANPLGH